MHSLSITSGLKTLCYYGNGHFSVHQGQSNIRTVCIGLQAGGTAREGGTNGVYRIKQILSASALEASRFKPC